MRDHDRGFLMTVSNDDRAYGRAAHLAVHETSCDVGIIGHFGRVFFSALHAGVV